MGGLLGGPMVVHHRCSWPSDRLGGPNPLSRSGAPDGVENEDSWREG